MELLILDWMYINPFEVYIVFFMYELCYVNLLRLMGSQRVGHDWATDLIWSDVNQKLEDTIVDKAGVFSIFTGW